MRTTVLGAGSWGTALSKLLGDAGHDVALWTRSPDHARDLAERRENVKYLAGVTLPATVAPTAALTAALDGAQLVLVVVPSHTVRVTMTRAARHLAAPTIVVSAAKGIEVESGATMADVLGQVLAPAVRVAVLSG